MQSPKIFQKKGNKKGRKTKENLEPYNIALEPKINKEANDKGRPPTVHLENYTRKVVAKQRKAKLLIAGTEITINLKMLLKQQQVKVGNGGGKK